MGLAHAPAVADDLVPGLPLAMRGLFGGPGQVDTGDHREAPHHRRLAGDGETVLVIHRRPLDTNGDITLHQVGFVELGERSSGTLFRLVDADCLESSHVTLPVLACASWPGLSRQSTFLLPTIKYGIPRSSPFQTTNT